MFANHPIPSAVLCKHGAHPNNCCYGRAITGVSVPGWLCGTVFSARPQTSWTGACSFTSAEDLSWKPSANVGNVCWRNSRVGPKRCTHQSLAVNAAASETETWAQSSSGGARRHDRKHLCCLQSKSVKLRVLIASHQCRLANWGKWGVAPPGPRKKEKKT